MASSSDCVDRILSQLKSLISSFPALRKLDLNKSISSHGSNIPLKRKLRDLGSGDIVLPKFIKLESLGLKSKDSELFQFVQQGLTQNNVPVTKVLEDEHNLLTFFLKRPQILTEIVTEVVTHKWEYGMSKVKNGQVIFLNLDSSPQVDSLTNYRMTIVASHTRNLLKANGYDVHFVDGKSSLEAAERNCADPSAPEPEQACIASTSSLSSQGKGSSLCHMRFMGRLNTLLEERDCEKHEDSHCLYVEKILADHNLLVGKDGIDKNLHQIEVLTIQGKPSEILEESINLEHSIDQIIDSCDKRCQKEKPVHTSMHIAAQKRSFRQQQVLLLALALSDKSSNQSLLVVGPVLENQNRSMDDVYRNRFDQMKQASEMRSGQKCEGLQWTSRLNVLTTASLTFDLLGTACHGPLRVDLASSTPADSRLGAFVLYNTARLASLLSHFSQEVEKGTYPPLPAIDTVDFSLLREEEEWELAFLYISLFPDIVRDSVEVVSSDHGHIRAKIHTHKVANFLTTFCKCLSSYYSRYHILGGGEAHLLPLMYARLYLMQATHQVLVSALHLLDIPALEQL